MALSKITADSLGANAVTANSLSNTAITTALGFTPANNTSAGITTALGYTPANKAGDTFTGSVNATSIGVGNVVVNTSVLVLPVSSSDPSPAANGMVYYNSANAAIKLYANNAWSTINTGARDPYWTSVALYLRGGSTNDLSQQARSITPVSVSTVSTPGKPFVNSVSTAWYLIGGSGTGNYIQVGGTNTDLDPSENTNLTIEFWLYKTGTGTGYGHFYWIGGQGGQGVIKYAVDYTSYGLYWYSSNGEAINFGSGSTSPNNQWIHYAFEKYGSTLTTWRNGTRIVQNTNTFPSGVDASGLRLGYAAMGAEYGTMYFDELRVTKAARYQGVATIPVQSDSYPTQ